MEHPCPQCGAPVVLEETDRILQCEYCRTRLFISTGGHSKYFLSPKESAPELFFLPYWRFKGMVFSCTTTELAGKIVDSNLLALKLPVVPVSLGVRPQVLKLRHLSPAVEGVFLTPQVPCRTLAVAGHGGCATQRLPDTFIGETESLIYSPVSVRGDFLFDAILQRPICQLHERMDLFPSEPARQEDRISFLATLCPECGWDLEGEKDSLVLLCRKCNKGWQPEGSGLERIEFGFTRAPVREAPAVYLPFWRITTTVTGLALKSYADLARLANLPRAIHGDWEEREPHFWVPAFKTQPHLFLRLSKSLSILENEPELDCDAEIPTSPLFPVTLPLGEALASLKILTASLAPPGKPIFSIMDKLNFSVSKSLLLYLPFISRGEELIQPGIAMSIQRNALLRGRLI